MFETWLAVKSVWSRAPGERAQRRVGWARRWVPVGGLALSLVAAGCGCRDYTDCQLQPDGDYECYAPTCPVEELEDDLPDLPDR